MRVAAVSTALILALAVGASGCKPKQEATAPIGPAPVDAAPSTPADAAAPLTFSNKTADAEITLKLPAAVARQPDLHARLYADGVKELKAFSEGATGERAEAGGEGIPPYSKEIAWDLGADTGKLMSLARTDYEYAGGAHPNHSSQAVLWDKSLKRQVQPGQLIRGDGAALDAALCDAIVVAKKERLGADATPPGGDWKCPSWRSTPFVLVPSTTGGKAGGLKFMIAPYAVGPYAEGGYEVVVPLSAFQTSLAAAYADDFAGQPQVQQAAVAPAAQ